MLAINFPNARGFTEVTSTTTKVHKKGLLPHILTPMLHTQENS